MSEAAADVVPDHVLGDPGAPVVVVEYGDFECPYCAALAPVVHDLVEESDGRVALIYRNYPLADVHPHALTAALAAEATAEFGVFWQMHDLLFQRQSRLSDPDLRSYAESLGVNGALVVGQPAQRFGDKVERDFLAGVELGVPGTPTLFINDVRYEGRLDLTSLRRATAGSTGTAAAGGRRWWKPR
jgi:protein-disulfide isomerase